MAKIKSQLKRNLTNEKARINNAAKKSAMRTAMKKVKVACEAKDKELAQAELKNAARLIDKAKGAKVIKPNAAARKKSLVQREVNELLKPSGN